jgi:hypothetical protein
MKKEGTIGAAAFLAIAAMVGYSVQTGPKPAESSGVYRNAAGKHAKPTLAKVAPHELRPGCDSLKDQLADFLESEDLAVPDNCYEKDDPARYQPHEDPTDKTSQLKFVVALLPDPVHTHLPVVFDQFAAAIQEGAQDEKYDFDGSWLPWDEEETPYALFLDEKAANRQQELKETQPGIIVFRKIVECATKEHQNLNERDEHAAEKNLKDCRDTWETGGLSKSYRAGLIVFVVGEEATHGIHKDQFRNALAWIKALRPQADTQGKQMAILGPTYSGTLPSLTQVLSETDIKKQLNLSTPSGKTTGQAGSQESPEGQQLAIFSGSVSSSDAAHEFQDPIASQVVFHSFVQNDDEILLRFCTFIRSEQPGFDVGRVAMISEDETAYGGSGVKVDRVKNDKVDKSYQDDGYDCREGVLQLYYPRDISALREAYQTKSLFDGGTAPQATDTQRRNLPTDLADPSGRVHDSIRSYGGNQTPLAQEAFLMDLVAALRELHARYILLRSSNTLDQLFLSDFLRRSYPDGRIVIFGSDLMFIREQGATGLNGSMTLSTYPLFPLEHRWTDHQRLAAADRVFSSDTSEGTYVAFRLLLNDQSLNKGVLDESRCHVRREDEGTIFLPSVACGTDMPIPDYSPPFWMLSDQCGEKKETSAGPECPYPGPATWLSVIGVNRFWPMASLLPPRSAEKPQLPSAGKQPQILVASASPQTSEVKSERANDPGGRPGLPLGMKVLLLVLVGFSVFHACCCWFGSYTLKPAFRAHFASSGGWRHTWLILAGSCCVACLAVVAGWGCGVFSSPDAGLAYPWFALCCMLLACFMTGVAIFGHIRTAWLLSKTLPAASDLRRITDKDFNMWNYQAFAASAIVTGSFCVFFVVPLQQVLGPENRVLTYWRATHLASGVSPIVPVLSILVALYLSFWFKLHGLALFGPDRPCLPKKEQLLLGAAGQNRKDFLRMFSQEDAAEPIEEAATGLNWKVVAVGAVLFVLFLLLPWVIVGGIPIRSLGAESYARIFIVLLDVCCSLALVEAWRMYQAWEKLRRLLEFLDRLTLRRTLAVLHGFSWGSVWKMSGNVLEVRYKVISRQLECMNHAIASIEALPRHPKKSKQPSDPGARSSLAALLWMHRAGVHFADWYSTNYTVSRAGDLTSFRKFQKSIAAASGTLLTKLLVPAWREEKGSLLAVPIKEEKDESAPDPPPQAKEEHIRNAEEFVSLNYLSFIQNVLGRLRTMAITIVVLFLAATIATSIYPFDPRQALSVILIVLFVITGVVIVKIYAEMHRDATLSHVTNTKPGELGTEFWFKILGFGFAPLIGLLTRVFPGIADFVFSWLQPGISTLK